MVKIFMMCIHGFFKKIVNIRILRIRRMGLANVLRHNLQQVHCIPGSTKSSFTSKQYNLFSNNNLISRFVLMKLQGYILTSNSLQSAEYRRLYTTGIFHCFIETIYSISVIRYRHGIVNLKCMYHFIIHTVLSNALKRLLVAVIN